MKIDNFFAELKRRNVYKVSVSSDLEVLFRLLRMTT
jgi:hypothetical protein